MPNKNKSNQKSLFIKNVFSSSTFDNIKAKFKIKHEPLGVVIPYDNNNKSMTSEEVFNSIGNTSIKVRSSKDGDELTIDGSYIKWLTGQNVIGSSDLIYLCLQVFLRVCKTLNLSPTQEEIEAIKLGKFILLRVDYSVHCDAGDESTVIFLQQQIKRNWALNRPNYSHYRSFETLYSGQSSKRRTFKTYMKGREIVAKGGLANVLNGNDILNISKQLLRIELTWRNKALKDISSITHPKLKLCNPLAWKGNCAQKLMKAHIRKLLGDITGMTIKSNKSLSNADKIVIAAHKADISIADIFDPRAYKRIRDKLIDRAGIDIALTVGKHQIRKDFLVAQRLIKDRIKYRSHRALVKLMMDHADSDDSNITSVI